MLVCGQLAQSTMAWLKPKMAPAPRAPAKRIPSARPNANAPRAATKTFSIKITASACQKGRTYAGRLKGENTADCALARNGRPPITWGFQSGTSGSARRVSSMNGWNCVIESDSSKFDPSGDTPAGTEPDQGAACQR